MIPTQREQDIAAANLQRAYVEYVQNPCTEKIDVLEHAILVYDGVQAGMRLEEAICEYEDYVAEGGNITRQLMNAGIMCGDPSDERYIIDEVNDRAGEMLDAFRTPAAR